ncbi:MAG: CPBP family intramembrane metalloprotease [Peptococcaceae bacterium]|nr:CPBP family intramembrane metalloprotease [Peptococcaceae bacterium]
MNEENGIQTGVNEKTVNEETGMRINRKVLLYNMILSQAILFLAGFLFVKFITPGRSFFEIFEIRFTGSFLLTFLAGGCLLLGVQFFFLKFISKDRLKDEINRYLMDYFSLPELFLIFFFGALAEEFLFRGVMQPYFGLCITAVLFTVIHFRYLRKIFLLIEVFLMGLILGGSYWITQTIWAPVCCHLLVNYMTAILIKKGYIEY